MLQLSNEIKLQKLRLIILDSWVKLNSFLLSMQPLMVVKSFHYGSRTSNTAGNRRLVIYETSQFRGKNFILSIL